MIGSGRPPGWIRGRRRPKAGDRTRGAAHRLALDRGTHRVPQPVHRGLDEPGPAVRGDRAGQARHLHPPPAPLSPGHRGQADRRPRPSGGGPAHPGGRASEANIPRSSGPARFPSRSGGVEPTKRSDCCAGCGRRQRSPITARFYSMEDVKVHPAPAQPGGPPIVVAGRKEPAMRRAALLGDGWMPYLYSARRYAASAETMRQIAAEAGRDLDGFGWYLFVFVNVDPDGDRARDGAARTMGGNYRQDFKEMVDSVAVAGTPARSIASCKPSWMPAPVTSSSCPRRDPEAILTPSSTGCCTRSSRGSRVRTLARLIPPRPVPASARRAPHPAVAPHRRARRDSPTAPPGQPRRLTTNSGSSTALQPADRRNTGSRNSPRSSSQSRKSTCTGISITMSAGERSSGLLTKSGPSSSSTRMVSQGSEARHSTFARRSPSSAACPFPPCAATRAPGFRTAHTGPAGAKRQDAHSRHLCTLSSRWRQNRQNSSSDRTTARLGRRSATVRPSG